MNPSEAMCNAYRFKIVPKTHVITIISIMTSVLLSSLNTVLLILLMIKLFLNLLSYYYHFTITADDYVLLSLFNNVNIVLLC